MEISPGQTEYWFQHDTSVTAYSHVNSQALTSLRLRMPLVHVCDVLSSLENPLNSNNMNTLAFYLIDSVSNLR